LSWKVRIKTNFVIIDIAAFRVSRLLGPVDHSFLFGLFHQSIPVLRQLLLQLPVLLLQNSVGCFDLADGLAFALQLILLILSLDLLNFFLEVPAFDFKVVSQIIDPLNELGALLRNAS